MTIDEQMLVSAPFTPPRIHRFAGLVSGAMIAFGLLCAIAANWSHLHRFTKFGLVGTTLLCAAAVASIVPRAGVPALLVAIAAAGGLLTLIGQAYPSGADAWQLFALWAALTLPFALGAREDAVWSLWVIIASAAITLWRVQDAPHDWALNWVFAVLLAAALLPHPALRRWIGRTDWAYRLATLGAVGTVAIDGCGAFAPGDAPFFAGIAVLATAGAVLIRFRPAELGLLAAFALAIDALLIIKFAIVITAHGLEIASAFLIGFVAAGIVAASVVLLRTVARRTSAPSSTVDQHVAPSPPSDATAPLILLSGVGAIFAAVPLLVFFALAFQSLIETAFGAAGLGVAVLACAVFALRGSAALGFQQMFATIGMTVGLGLIALGAALASENNAGFIVAAVSVVVAVVVPMRWIRSLLGFAAAVAFVTSVFMHLEVPGVGVATTFVSLFSAIAASVLLLHTYPQFLGISGRPFTETVPFLEGWLIASLCMLLCLAGRPFLFGAGTLGSELGGFMHVDSSRLSEIVSALLAAVGAMLLVGMRPSLRMFVIYAMALASVGLSAATPTLGPIIFALACGLLIGNRAVVAVASIATLWVISATYYALHWSLTEKAAATVALGLALGVVSLLTGLRRYLPQIGPGPTRAQRWPALLTAAGVLLTAVFAGTAIASAENILRRGDEVFIALRPVDPRSLVAGDYMALAFDTGRLPPASQAKGEVLARAAVDERSVAKIVGLDGQAASGDMRTRAFRLHTKNGRWFVGSDAWYFAEGEGQRFEKARYGVFRVSPTGRLLLTGLADEDLQRMR